MQQQSYFKIWHSTGVCLNIDTSSTNLKFSQNKTCLPRQNTDQKEMPSKTFDSHLYPDDKLSQQKKCKCNIDDTTAEREEECIRPVKSH